MKPPRLRELTMDAEAGASGMVQCPGCGETFALSDRWSWSGVRRRGCGQKIHLTNLPDQLQPVWCVVANIVGEHPAGPGGIETHRGSKHFPPGARVYLFKPHWDGLMSLEAIGHHRGSHQYETIVIGTRYLVNCRADLTYSPCLVDQLSQDWDGSPESKKDAEDLARYLNEWIEEQKRPDTP